MIYLAGQFWWAIVVALGLGVLFEAIAGPGRGSISSRRITRILALVTIPAGALVSGLELVGGRPGLWLDAAILIFTGYAVGCLLGAAVRGVIRRGDEPAEAAAAAPTGVEASTGAGAPTA